MKTIKIICTYFFIAILFISCDKEIELDEGVDIHGITIISGDKQTTYALTTLAEPLEILVEDANGNVFKNATVEFKVTEGIVSPRIAQTDEDGKTKVSWKLGKTVGKQHLTITAKDLTIPAEPPIGAPVIAEATATELPIRVTSESLTFDNPTKVVLNYKYVYDDNDRIIMIERETSNGGDFPNILLEYELGKLTQQSILADYGYSLEYVYGTDGNIDKTNLTHEYYDYQLITNFTYTNGYPTNINQDHIDLETNNVDEEYLNTAITYNNTFNIATVNVEDSGNRTSKKEFEFNDLGQLIEEKYYYNGELETTITFTYDTKNNPYLLLLSKAGNEKEFPQFKIDNLNMNGVSVANFDLSTSGLRDLLFYPFKNNVTRVESLYLGERSVVDIEYTYNEFEFPTSYTTIRGTNRYDGTFTYENFKDK